MKAQPAARYLAILIALVLIALGVVAGYEIWLMGPGASSGQSSIAEPVFSQLSQLAPTQDRQASLIAGIILAIIALLLLIAVLKPRKTTHSVYRVGEAEVYMRPVDVARMFSGIALAHPEVRDAETEVSKGKATVTVSSPHLSDAGLERIRADVERYATATQPPLQVQVNANRGDK